MTAPSSDRPAFDPNLSAIIRAALERQAASDVAPPRLDAGARVIRLEALAGQNWIQAPPEALVGRNIALLTRDQLSAAIAMCSLDSVAGRLVIVPPDLPEEHLPGVIAEAEIDAVVHDGDAAPPALSVPAFKIRDTEGGAPHLPASGRPSEWVMFTSGTTGPPKMVVHELAGLTQAIPIGQSHEGPPIVWATFYDIRRYGGLQMLLRALTGAHTMILTGPGEYMADFIGRVARAGATHVSGTPSHWRSALQMPALDALRPRYVRLSGEIADQRVLDQLGAFFPGVASGHAYASTEAGVGFEVTDGRVGFPAAFLGRRGRVEMHLQNDTLRLRSPGCARRFVGEDHPPIADADGFVDTGDLIEQRGERCFFMGRANGVINVGGLKVHPEEVEAVINRCPGVRLSRVNERRNPILGAVVAAEVVLEDHALGVGEAARASRERILDHCRGALTEFKVPASVKFVEALPMTAGGKLERRRA